MTDEQFVSPAPRTNMPKRTVLVAHPSAQFYGADRMCAQSVEAFIRAGHRVVVALPTVGPLTETLTELGAEVNELGVPVLRKGAMSGMGLLRYAGDVVRSLPSAWRFLRQVDADLVYVNTVALPPWIALARLARKPVVCHVHEAEDSLPRPMRKALSAPLLVANRVIANSEASRDFLTRSFSRLGRRTTVVYNGVPVMIEASPPRKVLEAPIRLVQIARIAPRKGTDTAVAALAILIASGYDVTLEIVGAVFPGNEWFEKQVRHQALEAGLEDRIHWSGETPDPWPSLAAADIALAPSLVESFGNAVVESILALRPVVAADNRGYREISTLIGWDDLVAPGDPVALAEAVANLIADWVAVGERTQLAASRARVVLDPARYRAELIEAVGEVFAPESS